MKKLFMAAIAALFALLGTPALADDVKVAVANTQTATTTPVTTVQSVTEALTGSKWEILIYNFPEAPSSMRGVATFKFTDGQLMAAINDRGSQNLMSAQVAPDGTVVLTSLRTGSTIRLTRQGDGFAGKSIATTGREWDVTARKS